MSGLEKENYHFKSNDFAIRAQKKILGKLNRHTAKAFISDGLGRLLDLLYQLVKNHTKDKKTAEKFVKNIIKLSIKIGVLAQNEKFSEDEVRIANKFAAKFKTTAMTITSFVEVDYSYDRNFLISAVNECEREITTLVKPHLTDKSVSRIHFVANILKDPVLLDEAFRRDSQQYQIIKKMVEEINKAIEDGDF